MGRLERECITPSATGGPNANIAARSATGRQSTQNAAERECIIPSATDGQSTNIVLCNATLLQ